MIIRIFLSLNNPNRKTIKKFIQAELDKEFPQKFVNLYLKDADLRIDHLYDYMYNHFTDPDWEEVQPALIKLYREAFKQNGVEL